MNEKQKQYASANSLVINLNEVAAIQWLYITPDDPMDNKDVSVRFYLKGHSQYFNRRSTRKALATILGRYKALNTDVLNTDDFDGEDE